MNYDLAVIGAGPGGYVAAIRGAQAGLKVALVEKGDVGGVCLNRGCIPTKAFAASAEALIHLKDVPELGIKGVDSSKADVDIEKVVARKTKIVETLKGGIKQLLKSNKVDYVNSAASFLSSGEVKLTDPANSESRLASRFFIIATGSEWRSLPGLTPDGQFIVTSDEILSLDSIPKRLVIVGGGVIGCEFASIMNAFGSEVTIVEFMDHILPFEDEFVARQLALSFKKRGIKVLTKATVTSASGGRAALSTGEEVFADKVMISVGRKPSSAGLGLEELNVNLKNGFIVTDEHMRTNVLNIFAVGDVASPAGGPKPALAHVASFEASIAVANLKGEGLKMDYAVVPRPIFASPEISCVGLTEKQLKEKGVSFRTGKFPYAASGKALCDGKGEGFLQAYTSDDGKILGAQCFGGHATDMCAEISLAMKNGLKAEDVAMTIHAHPTYSEMVVEALEDSAGKAVHKVKRS
jgi:dihydrolipoamide dehydrogenase